MGVKTGFGIKTFINNDRYEGEWSKNRKNGKGKMIYVNGCEFDGN